MLRHHLNALTVFDVKGWSLARGLQAGIGCCVPLLFAQWFRLPGISWVGIVAFLVALADPQWPPRSRCFTFVFLTLGIALGSYVAVLIRPYPWASAAFALIFSTVAVFTRVWGNTVGGAGNLVAIIVLIALGLPSHSSPHTAIAIAGLSLVGGLSGLVLAFTVGYKRSDSHISAALANVFQIEAAFVRDMMAPHSMSLRRGEVRDAIERAREVLILAEQRWGGSRKEIQRFTLMLGAADGAMTALLAIRQLNERSLEDPPSTSLNALANQLDAIAAAITMGSSVNMHILPASLAEGIEEPMASALRKGATWINAAVDYLLNDHLREDLEIPSLGARTSSHYLQLRDNLTFASLSLRHALRFGVTAAVLTLITKLLYLDYGYWITLTAVIVLQAYPSATWQRAAQRIGGSIGGGIIAASTLFLVHGTKEIMLIILPLSILSMALRRVSYAFYVLCITPLFILMTQLLSQGGSVTPEIGGIRIIYNLIGAAVALAVTIFLWPSWEQRYLRQRLAEDIRQNGAFLLMALDPDRDENALLRARRSAGLAANNAEASLQRAIDEPRRLPSIQISASMTVTAAARELTEIAAVIGHLCPEEWRGPDEAIRKAVFMWLDEIAVAVAEGRPPVATTRLELKGEKDNKISVELKNVVCQLALLEEAAEILSEQNTN